MIEIIKLIKNINKTTYLVTPVWHRFDYWQLLKKQASVIVLIPPDRQLYNAAQQYDGVVRKQRWVTALAVFKKENSSHHST